MVLTSTRMREPLERASPTLFLLAGAGFFTLLATGLTVRYTAASIPRTAYWPLFPLAVTLSMVGLLGLAPRLAERARRAATVGAAFGIAGAAMLVVGLGALLLASPPGPYPGSLGLLGAPFFLGLLAFVPATVIYGVLGLRTGLPSSLVGALLLLVGLLQFGELVGAAVLFSSAGTAAPSGSYVLFEMVVYGLIATALVVVGTSLRPDMARAEADAMTSGPESPAEIS